MSPAKISSSSGSSFSSDILPYIPTFLRVVSLAAQTFLSGSPLVHEVLSMGAALIERGNEASGELKALTEQLQAMADAKRDPTAEEWASLRARSDAAHAAIQAVYTGPGAAPPPAPPVTPVS